MKTQRVYVDTSIIGGCFDAEFSRWSNGLLDDFAQGRFAPVISELVTTEVLAAPPLVQDRFVDLLACSPEILDVSEATLGLANLYQARGILTPKYYNDGMHIALATVAEVDVLVSWNFKHIVHFHKIRMFNAVNAEQGYKGVQIYSPREVTTYDAE